MSNWNTDYKSVYLHIIAVKEEYRNKGIFSQFLFAGHPVLWYIFTGIVCGMLMDWRMKKGYD